VWLVADGRGGSMAAEDRRQWSCWLEQGS